jgi:RNA polymerase sigma-70 factor (ECF subfamily)
LEARLKGTWDADRDPLRAMAAGDSSPFEEFVRLETGTFLGFFQRLGADRDEAEDLTQEVFLKVYKSTASYDPMARFESFVLRVARNAWIDRRRRRATRPEVASLDQPAGDEAALAETLGSAELAAPLRIESEEDRVRVRAAVRRLPPAHLSVFELAVLQALPYAEVAAVLGIPVGTVKSRVFHALRKLRADLGEGGAP